MTKINEKRPGLAHFEGIYVKNVITSFKNINKRRKLAQKKLRRTLVLSNVGGLAMFISKQIPNAWSSLVEGGEGSDLPNW